MKRKFFKSSLLLSFLCLSLCSCDNVPKYHLEVLDYFSSDIISAPRSGDYKEGEKLTVVTPIITDVGIYVYLNGEKILNDVVNDNWVYEFTMPSQDSTLVITYDQYYGQDEFVLDDFLNVDQFILDKEVKEIRAEFGYVGVAPDSLNSVYYSDNDKDIEKALSLFEEKLVKYDDQIPSGGNYLVITYYPDDEFEKETTYRIINNRISDNDFAQNNMFKFVNDIRSLFDFDEVKLSSFTFNDLFKGNNTLTYFVKDSTGNFEETAKKFNAITEIEFVSYEEEAEECLGYLSSAFIDKIFIHSDKIFSYKNKMYQIISDQDFIDLI